eukprot:g612.t1
MDCAADPLPAARILRAAAVINFDDEEKCKIRPVRCFECNKEMRRLLIQSIKPRAEICGIVVAQAGLDFHVACRKAPHSKRPGTLLRFLRARNWNQELSLKLLQEALDWRRDYQLEEKLEAKGWE